MQLEMQKFATTVLLQGFLSYSIVIMVMAATWRMQITSSMV